MRRFALLLLCLCLVLPAFAKDRSSGSHHSKSSSSSKPVKVREYTRKDGTHVKAHSRSLPGTASASTKIYSAPPSHAYKPNYVAEGYTAHASVQRDKHGRIKRSEAAKNAFKRQHPCPANGSTSGKCPGYVIDHLNALECGGADDPSNMQWQTVAEGKAKDKTERYCSITR